MTDNRDIMAPAWVAAIKAAFAEHDARQAFHAATGRASYKAPTSTLDVLIERAVGNEVDDAYLREFIEWFTVNIWGEEYAPTGWRDMLEKEEETS